MTNRIQVLRSSTSGNVPAGGTRLPGELWVNFPDFQFGMIDAGKNAQKLLGVRVFSSTATYSAGDLVSQAGNIYSANGSIPPGAFTPGGWTKLTTMGDLVGAYVPIAGGTMTGALLLNADPSAALGAATKQYVDAHVTGFLPTAGGTMTGPLTISGAMTATPVGQNITLSPTGSGTVTINPTTLGHIDNTDIGDTTPKAGTFTNLNASNVNFTGGTIGSGVSITGVPAPSSTTPAMDGTAAVGTGTTYARADHVHPSDTTKANLSGASFTGTVAVGSNVSLPTTGQITVNGGAYFYSGTFGGNTVQVWNGNFQSSSYVGTLANTPNQFGANSSLIWGCASWSGIAGGGGAMYDRSDRTDCYMHGFLWGTSSLVGTISTNGSSVSYNSTSDGRLKKNIRALTDDVDVGELIDKIRPVSFEWKNRRGVVGEPGAMLFAPDGFDREESRNGKERTAKGTALGHGFIAQELIQVAPFAVHAPDDGKSELEFNFEEGVHPWGVDFSKLVPYLVAELQILRRRVAQLEGR